MVTKDDAGKMHVNTDEMATRHGAWGGAAVGALIGILFPYDHRHHRGRRGGRPLVAWHVPRRCQGVRGLIDQGQAALVIVGESKVEQAVDKAGPKAGKHIAKELNVSPKDVDKAVQEAATQVS